ncbi:unnamed protein product, partial [Symbiodinium necroappetens]
DLGESAEAGEDLGPAEVDEDATAADESRAEVEGMPPVTMDDVEDSDWGSSDNRFAGGEMLKGLHWNAKLHEYVDSSGDVPHTLWNTRDHWKFDDDYDVDKVSGLHGHFIDAGEVTSNLHGLHWDSHRHTYVDTSGK